MACVRLFVYGSLKVGFRHHDELAGSELLGPVRTSGGFRLVRFGEYPALVKASGPTAGVSGELFRVPIELLPALDDFEDCPALYRRQEIELSDGSHAFAYVITARQAEGLEPIDDGEWREEA